MTRRATALAVSCAAILLVLAALQIATPDGFFSGDQGAKYLQTRAFARNGPLAPGIEVASRDVDPAYRHQEPKLKGRRGRLVSEFLWLLPIASAPFVALFGFQGLSVIPALSVLVIFLAAAALGRALTAGSGLWAGWAVLLVTPVVWYGLEFWEHAPAAACVLVAAALLCPSAAAPQDDGSARVNGRAARFAAAGAMILIGALFREETLPALPALLVARALSMERDRVKELVVAGVWATAGAAAVFAASVPMNIMMYGAPLPMHVTQDAWQVATSLPFMVVRRQVVAAFLLPDAYVAAFLVAAGVGAAAAVAQIVRPRAALLAAVHVSAATILVIALVIPLTRPGYNVMSAIHTWPFVVALLYAPWLSDRIRRPVARFLIVSAVLLLAGTILVVPAPGGAQWSPRFLLPVAPLLAIVAAAAAWTSRAASVTWMARAILLASLVVQVSGLWYLRDAKARNTRITDRIAALTSPGDVVISDVYWVPEVIATLAPTRRILFAWSPAEVGQIAALAAEHGIRSVAVVSSSGETGYWAPAVLDGPASGCVFTRVVRQGIGERGLILHRYECRPGAAVLK